jgi:hypothetical protein
MKKIKGLKLVAHPQANGVAVRGEVPPARAVLLIGLNDLNNAEQAFTPVMPPSCCNLLRIDIKRPRLGVLISCRVIKVLA